MEIRTNARKNQENSGRFIVNTYLKRLLVASAIQSKCDN
jgi:hypothetical protein